MTDTDRKRLASILGMLGSNSAGERDNAARQAEAFRRKHGMTWEQLVSGETVYIDREISVPTPVYIDRQMPLIRSVASALSEPTPCVLVFTVGFLSLVALIREIATLFG